MTQKFEALRHLGSLSKSLNLLLYAIHNLLYNIKTLYSRKNISKLEYNILFQINIKCNLTCAMYTEYVSDKLSLLAVHD